MGQDTSSKHSLPPLTVRSNSIKFFLFRFYHFQNRLRQNWAYPQMRSELHILKRFTHPDEAQKPQAPDSKKTCRARYASEGSYERKIDRSILCLHTLQETLTLTKIYWVLTRRPRRKLYVLDNRFRLARHQSFRVLWHPLHPRGEPLGIPGAFAIEKQGS